ncbi:hypothetical protein [Burkholderia cepacia]|uniref:hypothetical protein n=1 Tax=Burkholderia cepacia TaxID=292 RepID=UPI002AB78914|nr:hypothetical protein [Burkholderia cepacia]
MASKATGSCPDDSSSNCQTPRVETLIDRYQAQFPGTSKAALSRYFEEVHQGLAPLARELERENAELRAQIDEAKQAFQEQFRNCRAPWRAFEVEPQLAGRVGTEPSLRAMVRAYYGTHCAGEQPEHLTDEYFREIKSVSTR